MATYQVVKNRILPLNFASSNSQYSTLVSSTTSFAVVGAMFIVKTFLKPVIMLATWVPANKSTYLCLPLFS